MTTSAARSHASPVPSLAPARERRRADRVRVKGLLCDRGEVIDLSTKGMRLRVHRRWHEGHVRTITVVEGGVAVPVEARCVWCRQEGMFNHVIGLAFQHTTERDVERLAEIAARSSTGEAD
jgi:hypothetical protein